MRYDSLFMNIAIEFSKMSYAGKKQVGAILVKNNSIISDGYNGTPSGYCNICEDPDGNTQWYVLHAEANAILKCSKTTISCENSTLYVTMSPCKECCKLIIQSGIKRVIYSEKYRDTSGLDFLGKFNIECRNMEDIYFEDMKEAIKLEKEKLNKEKEEITFTCKICQVNFTSKHYNGNYPLCKLHRNTFKK
jgi:dCMP deaminase